MIYLSYVQNLLSVEPTELIADPLKLWSILLMCSWIHTIWQPFVESDVTESFG